MPQPQESEQSVATRAECPACGGTDTKAKFTRCRDLLYSTPGEFSVMACNACGALFCDPQITPDQFDTYYLASYYPTAEQILARRANRVALWALRRFWGPVERDTAFRAAARAFFSAFSNGLRMMPPAHGRGRLLEVGCSSGERLFLLRRQGWDAQGIEPSTDACAEAAKLGAPVQVCSLENADLGAKSYDVIELCHVFEHLADPVGCLSKLRDALAPGGKILLTLPNARSLGLALFGRSWRGLEVPRHCVVYSPKALGVLCSRLGLRVHRVRNLVAPDVIVGSVKFALNDRRAGRRALSLSSTGAGCGSRYQPDRKLKNLAGRLVRKALALALLPAALLGYGEVMQLEIVRGESPPQHA